LTVKSKTKGALGGYRKSTAAVWKLVEEAYADDEDGIPTTETGRTITDIPMTCEPALMKRWTKNSKSVLDEKGRYVPCNV
jgi:hypothetical protein